MARAIDADMVLKEIDKGFDETDPSGEEQIGFLKCRRIVREAPAIEPKQEWISVKDRLPEPFVSILVYSMFDGVNRGFMFDDGRFCVKEDYPHTPTHWMPLPEPPKED